MPFPCSIFYQGKFSKFCRNCKYFMGKIVRNFWTIKYHRRNSMRASSEMSIIQKLRWNQPETFFGNFRSPHIECIEALVFKRIKMKRFLFYSSEALYAHWIISAASNSKRLHWRSIILNRSVSGVQFSFCIGIILYYIVFVFVFVNPIACG